MKTKILEALLNREDIKRDFSIGQIVEILEAVLEAQKNLEDCSKKQPSQKKPHD
jgi:hypothetical protein